MENKSWKDKFVRRLWTFFPKRYQSSHSSWRWLRFYPYIQPHQNYFEAWNQVDKANNWDDYQLWINQNSLSSPDDWHLLQQQAYQWQSPPKISIVTPVYNTDIDVLFECVNSIRAQAYPYWQLILVDDHSSKPETLEFLRSKECMDPRVLVHFCEESQGISKASNIGIEKAQGEYVVFLDHDDRLALDALSLIAKEIKKNPSVDIIYSDRDMISPQGERYMHLFKPDWSPETLLSGNYIFHFMCYRYGLLKQLGGFKSSLDGSQDYDLILRAAEMQPKVKHIQKVLYHWRQYKGSVALDSSAKDYAFKAGIKALNQAMQRRGIAGDATEISELWRGNYQLNLVCPDKSDIEIISIESHLTNNNYVEVVTKKLSKKNSNKPYIALMSNSLTSVKENAIEHLAAWLNIKGVGVSSGSMISNTGQIQYSGATYSSDGRLMIPYQGYSASETGYMAVTKLVRNISAPHPYCVLIRREVWDQLEGLSKAYNGYYALLDFTLRALSSHWRCVSVPQAQFMIEEDGLSMDFSEQDKMLFCNKWREWLEKGDPYYNAHLDRNDQKKLFHIGK